MESLSTLQPPNGAYSLANAAVRGKLQLAKRSTTYGFRGILRCTRGPAYDQIILFDYPKRASRDVDIDFEFPGHSLYLPSSFKYTDPRLQLEVSIRYEIYTSSRTWELPYQGKHLENTYVDSELVWTELDKGKVGVRRFFNVLLPLDSQITFDRTPLRVHIRLDSEILVNVAHRRTLSYSSRELCVVEWKQDSQKSLLGLCRTPLWCDCTILDLLHTSSQIVLGCEFAQGDVTWVSTQATLDFLIEERLPPGYAPALDNNEQLPPYSEDPPQYERV